MKSSGVSTMTPLKTYMMRIQSSCCRRSGIRNLQALNFYKKKNDQTQYLATNRVKVEETENDHQRPSFTGWEEALREEQRCSSSRT